MYQSLYGNLSKAMEMKVKITERISVLVKGSVFVYLHPFFRHGTPVTTTVEISVLKIQDLQSRRGRKCRMAQMQK
jgi:hypothetical protein